MTPPQVKHRGNVPPPRQFYAGASVSTRLAIIATVAPVEIPVRTLSSVYRVAVNAPRMGVSLVTARVRGSVRTGAARHGALRVQVEI